jgi:hypothetical protein
MINAIRNSLKTFGRTFLTDAYLAYTEHGLHPLIHTTINNALPEACRYLACGGQRMGVVQKEYPTAANLGRSRRQHWDIAVLRPDQIVS